MDMSIVSTFVGEDAVLKSEETTCRAEEKKISMYDAVLKSEETTRKRRCLGIRPIVNVLIF